LAVAQTKVDGRRREKLTMSNASASASVRISSLSFDWVKVALCTALAGLIYYAYWIQPVEGKTTCYRWLTGHWSNVSNYSHGPLIPLIALGLVFWRRKELMAQQVHPVNWAPAVVALAAGFYYLGVKAVQPRIVVFSFIVLLYGLALTLGGRGVFRILFFPITFLFLMIPLNFLDEMVGFPLRIYVAQASTALLNWLGIETVRVGTGIYSRVFRFDVADPCSGIRSLMALTTVTAAYAYVTQKSQWKRWALFLSSLPLAVLGNMARVVSIALVAQVYGQEVAGDIYHKWSGFILFPVALGAMVILGILLNFPYRHLWESWMNPIEQHETHE
jgi:exosortase